MKILHYLFGLPPVRTGGLPKYAIDLMQEQKKQGQDVCMLVPGTIKGEQVSIKKWKQYEGIPCYRIINSIPIPNAFGIDQPKAFMPKISDQAYFAWLEKIKPDVIHVHSLLGIHLEFFKAAQKLGIAMVYTTHDYFGLCPKIDYLRGNANCTSTDWSECIECCKNAYSLKRLKLEQSDIYRMYCESRWLMDFIHGSMIKSLKRKVKLDTKESRMDEEQRETEEVGQKTDICDENLDNETIIDAPELQESYRKLQAYYVEIFKMIDYYHFNSNQTREVYEHILGVRRGEAIPVLNRGISDRRAPKSFGRELRIGYLGNQMPMKGYDYLIRELDQVYESGRREFILNTYLIENTHERPYIRNHKPFSAEQQKQVYDEMDVLVVPSQWRETFGMVVLEALSYGVPVLVSEHVGAKMLLGMQEDYGMQFFCKKGNLAEVIQKLYDNRNVLTEMNRCIMEAELPLNYVDHVGKIGEMYKKIIQ